jgi:hypothetical protein
MRTPLELLLPLLALQVLLASQELQVQRLLLHLQQ